jgi:predicted phosphoribosyltransferase
MFRDRADAAEQLVARLKELPLDRPVVVAIPRGGVALGALLARAVAADLDVVLSRKLRAPEHPELAIGAIAEDGQMFANDALIRATQATPNYLAAEKEYQRAEIGRRQKIYRGSLPPIDVRDRTVIVTDDGIATGATMLAALQAIRLQRPREVILAVPVASPARLKSLEPWCDRIICLAQPQSFQSVGQFYNDFTQLDDDEVVALLEQGRRRR